jgi:DNA-binding LacI/PurR family transcriptional regulator
MKRRRLTQNDVAARAETTQTLVSRVIARDRRVNPLTAARVWRAIEELFAEYPPVRSRLKDGAA